MSSTVTRSYRSAKRADQAAATRFRILTAATRQFAENGFAATSIRTIAAEAGVSVPAVELHFRSKPQLLKAAIDVAIAGDDEPVPVLSRDWVGSAESDPSARGFLDRAAEALWKGQTRSAGLILTAYEASKMDSDIRQVVQQLEAGRAGTAEWVITGVSKRVPLRPGLTQPVAVDTVWLLMDPVVFRRLTGHRGWTGQQYQSWFVDSVLRLLTTTTE